MPLLTPWDGRLPFELVPMPVVGAELWLLGMPEKGILRPFFVAIHHDPPIQHSKLLVVVVGRL